MSATAPYNGTEVAVIGMSGRFPGASDVETYWRNLVGGVESVVEFTDEQLRAAGVDPALLQNPQLVRKGMVLDDVDRFAAGFFGLPPREAEATDPQHRLFLECAWEALEHAACAPDTFRGLIGVFAGSGFCRYLLNNLATHPELLPQLGDLQIAIGNERDSLCSMVSYKLDLRGPSIAVQTFCSTSLVAVHLACQSLINFECDIALAGGVAIDLPQEKGYFYTPGGVLSPDGRCRTFDARAEGSIMGNGVAIVALKRLEDALAGRDPIHAVIRGSAVNNDGVQKVGYTAPGLEGQSAVIAQALGSAGVDPATVTYVEAHGTATPLGDSVELAALIKAYRSAGRKRFCALGSAKTNIGHLDRAAGTAGLIKAVLSLENRLLPPSLHFERPNPDVDLDDSPFYVNTGLTEWRRDGGPLRAGVSSFGVGGTNAHVILEEAPPREPGSPSRPWQLLVLSAKTAGELDGAAARLAAHLRRHPDLSLADTAYTLQLGRSAFNHRRILICSAPDPLESAAAALETHDPKRVFSSFEERRDRPVTFLLPGLGDQYPGMARGLYADEPVFREVVDRCCALLAPELGLDLREVILPPSASDGGDGDGAGSGLDLRQMLRRGAGPAIAATLNRTRFAQPAVFVVEVALAHLLISWRIEPQALIGYSLGEYTAACLAGVLSLEDALLLVARRAAMIEELPEGAMLGVTLAAAAARDWLTGDLCLAGINGPALAVVAGPTDQIEALEGRLAAAGIICRRVATTHAFHSAMMRPIAGRFREMVSRLRLQPPRIPYLSNVTGGWISAEQATDPEYWVRHLCEPVRFADGLRELLAEPDRILLEVGPGQTLGTFARQLPEAASATVLSSLRFAYDRQPDQAYLLTTLGRLWLAGAPVDWPALYRGETRQRLPLPTYAFERKRYWIEPGTGGPLAARPSAGKKPDAADWFYLPAWKPSVRPAPAAAVRQEEAAGEAGWLVFVDGHSLGLRLLERLRTTGRAVAVRPGSGYARRGPDDYEIAPGAEGDYERLLAELRTGGAGASGPAAIPRRIVHLWSAGPPPAPPAESFAGAQSSGFFSLLFLAQALGRQNVVEPLSLLVVSSGAHEVTGAEEILPERATLAGPCRVIPQEFLNVICRTIDVALPPPASWREERLVERLAAELALDDTDLTIAYRGDDRWVQEYLPVRLEGAPARRPRLREEGVYLLTGGLGGVGLILAEHLAHKYRAKLVLLGRSGLPPRERWPELSADTAAGTAADTAVARRIRKILEIEAAGAEVLVVAADVADPRALDAALTSARQRFGALHGVIHAAGLGDDSGFRTIQETSPAECEWQFRPKVHGLRVLAEALRGEELDFVLLFSSIAAVLGGLGYVAYTAANAFMDAFTRRLARDSRIPWITVNWDSWPSRDDLYGVVGGTVAELTMTREEAGEAFERVLCGAAGPQIVHSTGDLQARIDQWVKLEASRQSSRKSAGPRHERPDLSTRFVAPEGEAEVGVALLWEELLGIEPLGAHDDFFELGGHSLLATQLFSRLRSRFGVDLPLRSIFEAPTIAGLAGMIAAAGPGRPAAATPPSTMMTMTIPRADRTGEIPLSFPQQRLWFLCQLEPDRPVYDDLTILRLEGPLDPVVLARTLAELRRRHEILRTTFPTLDGRPVQRIAPSAPLGLPLLDLSALEREAAEREVRSLVEQAARQVSDLVRGPLLRARLLRLPSSGHGEHALLIGVHHILTDGWSQGVLVREMTALYAAFLAGAPSPLPELPLQYADFAVWQRQWLEGEAVAAQLAHWQERLAGLPPLLTLPTDRPRPPVRSYRGASHPFRIPDSLVDSLGRLEGVTRFMALLAGFQALLGRLAGQQDVVVGTPVANRVRPELELLLGLFVNTLALRADLTGDPGFGELLRRVRETTLDAYAHQDLPFERLVDDLRIPRDLGQTPVFQVLLVLQNVQVPVIEMGDLTLRALDLDNPTARFDLTLTVVEEAGGRLAGSLTYATELFDASSAARLAEQFLRVLETAAADPRLRLSEIPLLSAGELRQLLAWNDTAVVFPRELPMSSLFARQAARTPAAVAVAHGEDRRTYGELAARAWRLAHHLRRLGVGPETRVGICMERTPRLVEALLAVWAAGGAYVPLDPAFPAERLAFLVADAGLSLILTDPALLPALPPAARSLPRLVLGTAALERQLALESAQEPAETPPAEGLAYVLYTSGSTGRPKGVGVPHAALVNFLSAMAKRLRLGEEDTLLAVTTLSFDIAGLEIWLPLLGGARVELLGREEAASGEALIEALARSGATALQATPATWRLLLAAGWAGDGKLTALCGGEALPGDLADRLRERCGALWNLYGPTETTVWSTAQRLERPGELVTLGRPLDNTRLLVLDRQGAPVPIRAPGELFIGGDGVARGYLGQPGLTAQRFVPDPYPPAGSAGERLYRTGDLVRRLDDGRLEFLGRVDHQVKVRGFRIELGEVEAALELHPAVRQAVVTVWRGEGELAGGDRLVAYVVPDPATAPAGAELRAFLAERLPEPMLPALFCFLEALPLTPSGKLDRRALPPPSAASASWAASGAAEGETGEAAGTALERLIAGLWRDLLELSPARVDDNFFALGGDSIRGAILINRLQERLGRRVPVRALFQAPTVAGLAAWIESAGGSPAGDAWEIVPLTRQPGAGLPLSFAQQRIWFVERSHPGQGAYNSPAALHLAGPLDLPALQRTASEIVRRHEILRASFEEVDGAPVQRIAPPWPVRLPVVDLEALPVRRRSRAAEALVAAEAERPFDLARGPLLRWLLVRLASAEHVVLLTLHHIVSDAWTGTVLVHEIGALYRAFVQHRPSPLPELPIQYADFAAWQRRWVESGVLKEDLAWWRETLRGPLAALELPVDRPRPARRSQRGARLSLPLDPGLTSALRALSRRRGVTLFTTLLAGFQALLFRRTRQEDLLVGAAVAGRGRPELEGLIGVFLNMLVLRTDLAGDPSFLELLDRTRDTVVGAFAHQDLPFDTVVEALRLSRDPAQSPLFQVAFGLDNVPESALELPGVSLRPLELRREAVRFDLTLWMIEEGEGLAALWTYSTDLFHPPTIARLHAQYELLLRGAMAAPETPLSQLALASGTERESGIRDDEDWSFVPARTRRRLAANPGEAG